VLRGRPESSRSRSAMCPLSQTNLTRCFNSREDEPASIILSARRCRNSQSMSNRSVIPGGVDFRVRLTLDLDWSDTPEAITAGCSTGQSGRTWARIGFPRPRARDGCARTAVPRARAGRSRGAMSPQRRAVTPAVLETSHHADFRDRYRDMARTLEFEGHIAWAEAMP